MMVFRLRSMAAFKSAITLEQLESDRGLESRVELHDSKRGTRADMVRRERKQCTVYKYNTIFSIFPKQSRNAASSRFIPKPR